MQAPTSASYHLLKIGNKGLRPTARKVVHKVTCKVASKVVHKVASKVAHKIARQPVAARCDAENCPQVCAPAAVRESNNTCLLHGTDKTNEPRAVLVLIFITAPKT